MLRLFNPDDPGVLPPANFQTSLRDASKRLHFHLNRHSSERIGPKGPVYRQLFRKTGPGKGIAVWLGPDLKEIWRAELPLVEKK